MERNHIIAKIEERDLIQLQQLQQEVFNSNVTKEKAQSFYETIKDNKDIHALGYYIKDNLVGIVILNVLRLPSGKEATIWDLAVKEEYRRLGIATKLMNQAEEMAKKEESKRIWLFSGFHRENAHALYRKLGYDENRDKAFVKFLEKEN